VNIKFQHNRGSQDAIPAEKIHFNLHRISQPTENVDIFPPLFGPTPLAILSLQKKINADMLVIATHGQTAIEEFLWANTASKIIRYAKCSVLVMKKPKYS